MERKEDCSCWRRGTEMFTTWFLRSDHELCPQELRPSVWGQWKNTLKEWTGKSGEVGGSGGEIRPPLSSYLVLMQHTSKQREKLQARRITFNRE